MMDRLMNSEAAMSTARPEGTPKGSRAWEPPAFSELALDSDAGSNDGTRNEQSAPPLLLPGVTLTKLGFSIESSFPLATRTEK
jgi:hypothetical protein